MSNTIYEWSFSDSKNRGKLWYILAISVILGLTIWGIFTKQYGLSFIVILLAGISLFIENNSSETIEVKINELGIKIGEYFYDFKSIDNYSFIYSGENAIFLRLTLNKKGIKKIDLKIDNYICSKLKNILNQFINEEKGGELTFSEKMINLLKL
ncbi:MAG: hypothetical protein PHI37_01025 [Candidatus Gracilibacteria bacterium]|nr:hypothetical protein [Candidatus Gracilibacteria bacterium]